MNPRPILIATCCAIALVAVVYFYGQHKLKETPVPVTQHGPERIHQPSKPTTVGNSETNETPATNSEQTTSVTEQPAETVDIEVDNTPTEAETPSNTSNHQAPEVHPDWLEYQSISNQLAKIESSRPKREDFQSSIDYTDAWIAWHDSVESESASLQSRQSEILKSYMKTLSPTEILNTISKLKELVDEDDYRILETHLQDLEVPIETQN